MLVRFNKAVTPEQLCFTDEEGIRRCLSQHRAYMVTGESLRIPMGEREKCRHMVLSDQGHHIHVPAHLLNIIPFSSN